MRIDWSYTRQQELDECLDLEPNQNGAALVGREAARRVWRGLLEHPAAIVVSLHDANPPAGQPRLVAFGASVFVKREFLDAERAQPRPDLNSRIVAALHEGRSILPSRREMGEANASPLGLDALILDVQVREALRWSFEAPTACARAFIETHAGYRLNRVVRDNYGKWANELTLRTGDFTLLADFPEDERQLWSCERSAAAGRPGSMANMIFLYEPPVMRFREPHQELLGAALAAGQRDEELAARLGLSAAAVKARWKAIFGLVADAKPELLGGGGEEEGPENQRGSQKRHRIIDYVRRHPSELRPYAWGS